MTFCHHEKIMPSDFKVKSPFQGHLIMVCIHLYLLFLTYVFMKVRSILTWKSAILHFFQFANLTLLSTIWWEIGEPILKMTHIF